MLCYVMLCYVNCVLSLSFSHRGQPLFKLAGLGCKALSQMTEQ